MHNKAWGITESEVAYTSTGSVSCTLRRPNGHVVTVVTLGGRGLDSRLHVMLSFDSLTEARKAYARGLTILKNLPDRISKDDAVSFVTRERTI